MGEKNRAFFKQGALLPRGGVISLICGSLYVEGKSERGKVYRKKKKRAVQGGEGKRIWLGFFIDLGGSSSHQKGSRRKGGKMEGE